MRRWILALVAACALVPIAGRAQVPPLFTPSGNPIWTGQVTSQAATGQSTILPLQGHSNCTVIASDTVGGASITVFGTAQPGPTATSQWFVNQNFGVSGVISVTSSPASSTGNVANYPGGFYFTWSGNTGTLSAYASCSTAVAKRTGAGTTGATQPIFVSTGTVTTTTAATANAYSQIGTTQSVTTTTSSGPSNAWLVTLTLQGGLGGTAAQPVEFCATSPTAVYTVLDQMASTNAAVCAAGTGTTGTNVMGAPTWGQALANNNNSGASQIVLAHVTVPNSTTFSMNCYVAPVGAVAQTVTGYCCIEAIPI